MNAVREVFQAVRSVAGQPELTPGCRHAQGAPAWGGRVATWDNHTDPGLRASVKPGHCDLHGTVTAAPPLAHGTLRLRVLPDHLHEAQVLNRGMHDCSLPRVCFGWHPVCLQGRMPQMLPTLHKPFNRSPSLFSCVRQCPMQTAGPVWGAHMEIWVLSPHRSDA